MIQKVVFLNFFLPETVTKCSYHAWLLRIIQKIRLKCFYLAKNKVCSFFWLTLYSRRKMNDSTAPREAAFRLSVTFYRTFMHNAIHINTYFYVLHIHLTTQVNTDSYKTIETHRRRKLSGMRTRIVHNITMNWKP